MASERFFRTVSQDFTVDGAVNGTVNVATAKGFKVKAFVIVKSSTQPPLTLEIKRVSSPTTIEVGPQGPDMLTRTDLSSYLVADNAKITQPRQKRMSIGPGEIDRATYEEEPTVARRVVLTDEFGDLYDEDHPLPVDATVSVGDIQVGIDAKDGDNVAVSSHPGQIRDQAPDTLTTAAFEEIYSYTSASNLSRITQVVCTASTACTFRLYSGSTLLRELRSSPLERNVTFLFTEHLKLPAGTILKVEAQVDRLIFASYETHSSIEGYLA